MSFIIKVVKKRVPVEIKDSFCKLFIKKYPQSNFLYI